MVNKRKISLPVAPLEQKKLKSDAKTNDRESQFVSYVKKRLAEEGDETKGIQMAKYMKTSQFFYGVQAPIRKQIVSELKKNFDLSKFEDFDTTVKALWTGKSREEQYIAAELCHSLWKKYEESSVISLMEQLIRNSDHWDLLDPNAATMSRVIAASKNKKQLEEKLKEWSQDPNKWVRRASLLGHLHHKKDTNTALLKETILLLIHEREFYICKAIGWVLREYGKSNGSWVKAFVNEHVDDLAPLSKREALKHLS